MTGKEALSVWYAAWRWIFCWDFGGTDFSCMDAILKTFEEELLSGVDVDD